MTPRRESSPVLELLLKSGDIQGVLLSGVEQFVYRFRSADALLDGYHELENQEIYFASVPQLNDPLEGFKDLFWRGDAIVWKNFFRHYLLCIMQAIFFQEYTGMSAHHSSDWNAIASSFPETYLSALERLLYFDWYMACFVADPTQASMWGTYADSHRGVCLKFRTSLSARGKPALTLQHVTGFTSTPAGSAPTYDFRALELQEVQYCERYAEIDFFRSLGRLTPSQTIFWFTGAANSLSSTGIDLLRQDAGWQQGYWETFETAIATKLKDWQHEKEYRLTLHSTIVDLREPSLRKLRYRFSDLQGIVFGMKTPIQEKMAIVRIIQEKCRQEGRKEFEIHQTYYSRRTGRIETTPWNLFKIA